MSQSAPWSYQGMPQGNDAGQIKLFNPAQFSSDQSNQQPAFDGNNQPTAMMNGQPENTGNFDGGVGNNYNNWDYGQQSQENVVPNQNSYAQGQGLNPQTDQTNAESGQTVDGNGQYYDPNQQYYQQYWDPNQQQWQQQQQYAQYNYGQQWNNFNVDSQQSVGGGDSVSEGMPQQQQQQFTNNYTDISQGHYQSGTIGEQGLIQNQDSANSQTFSEGQQMQYGMPGNLAHLEGEQLNMSQASEASQSSVDDSESNTYDSSINSSLQSSHVSGNQSFSLSGSQYLGGSQQSQALTEASSQPIASGEISYDNVQTVDLPAGPYGNTGDVQTMSNQFQHVSLNDNHVIPTTNENAVSQDIAGSNSDKKTNSNQSAFEGQGSSHSTANTDSNTALENNSLSPQSDDQQGLSDWEVVPPQMLNVPGQQSQGGSLHHSREGSIDNNVSFFIGSSRNSEAGSRGTPDSFMQNQSPATDNIGNTEKELSVINEATQQNVNVLGITTNTLVPQFTSSPNMSPAQHPGNARQEGPGDKTNSQLPPPPNTSAPPTDPKMGGANPFRKGGHQASEIKSNAAPPVSMINPGIPNSSRPNKTEDDMSNRPTLQMPPNEMEPPSPILSGSEETVKAPQSGNPVAPRAQPQSPIMPRRESPFQPPTSRLRSLSGQSNESSIEEHPKLEDDMAKLMRPSSEDLQRDKSLSMSSRGSGSSKDSLTAEITKNVDQNSSRDMQRDQHQKQSMERSKMRPPMGSKLPSGSRRGVMSPRRMETALQQSQKQRAKHNMSPATTLWADNDLVLPATNFLLAPAAAAATISSSTTSNSSSVKSSPAKSTKDMRDVLSPVETLISSLSEKTSKENTPEPSPKKQEQKPIEKQTDNRKTEKGLSDHRRESRRETSPTRDRHERGSSIDRELEISRRIEEKEMRKEMYDSRDRDREYIRDDKYSRDQRYRDYDPYYDRQGYRDRGRGYHGDERYERPRSRHSILDDDRPSSRQGQESDRPRSRHETDRPRSRHEADRPRSRHEYDRPRSRQDYNRDPYYRDKYGREKDKSEKKNEKVIGEIPEYTEGYDYDYYGRHGYYDRHGYYGNGYYPDNRYNQGYYDEYYRTPGGNKYDESFNRLLQFDYQNQWAQQGYPGQYNDPYRRPYDDADGYSQRSASRGHTPGSLSDAGDQLDYGYGYGSRADSRQGYDEYTRAQWDAYYANYYGYGKGYEEEVTPARMTPVKHSIPHLCVHFGPGGQLVKVLPSRPADGQPAMVEIHDISEMLQENPETEELKAFPGPLVRGDTHKNDVLLFCQRKAKECAENIQMTDRESAELIWKYLELLIKQNGTTIGTDVADLLLEGHEPTTMEYSMMGMKIAHSLDNLDEALDDTVDVNASVATDRSMINKGRKSLEEVTDRFRHLLLYGRKKDALEWAMKNNLWGHALFLASKLDSRSHANVMTRFANSAMKMNDPLQTLYQLMSGRQPAAVTCAVDEKWGDWRPHLAMVLSNNSARPDLDKKSIMTLGDTLSSKGFLHASHLCYLMAQVNFGSYQKKTSKMVLIGSNHSQSLKSFASNEAIQCTEIYEYALSLGNPTYYSVNFQYFKLLYACRLAESGFAQEALQYFEMISRQIQHSPTLFQPVLVKLTYELGNRLKHFDPQRLHSGEDTEDPFWLQQLQRINQGLQDGSIQPISGSVTPYGGFGTRAASTESGEVANYIQGTDVSMLQQYNYNQDQSFYQQQQQYQTGDITQGQGQQEYTPAQTQEINQQQQQGYNQYQQEAGVQYNQQQQQQTSGMYTQQNVGQFTQTQQDGTTAQGTVDAAQYSNYEQYNTGQGYNAQYTENQNQQFTAANQNQAGEPNQMYNQSQNGHFQQGQHNANAATSHTNAGQEPQDGVYGGHRHPHGPGAHRNSIASTTSGSLLTEGDDDELASSSFTQQSAITQKSGISHHSGISQHGHNYGHHGDELDTGHTTSSFDYFEHATTAQIRAPQLRKRTTSETSTGSTSNTHVTPSTSTTSTAKKPESIPEQDNKKNTQSKGLFGGIFSKIMGKGANSKEMKLPDDKKPSIVWDAANKKWVNQDEGAEEQKPPPPPPKDMDSAVKPLQPALGPSSSSVEPPAGNKFSLPKGRGSSSRYVNVMDTKPVTSSVPTSLFNVMPSSKSAPVIFSPGNTPNGENSTNQEQNNAAPKTETAPSGEQSAEMPSGELSRTSSMSSMSCEVQYYLTKGALEGTPAPSSMPVMYNPSQFQSAQPSGGFKSGPASTRSSGRLKPGQRRVYPK